jgi:hypothetical protein
MDMALVRLRAARADLDLALPDKGGHREIAIRDIDQAIKSVEEGIKYAEEHPEEFPGRRGGRGPRGDTTPPATTTTTTAVGG